MANRKRSRDSFEIDNSVSATLARLKDDLPATADGSNSERNGEWTTVEGRSSKRKKNNRSHDNYPSIGHSPSARLNTFVKIADLQNLVLYLLADGTAPQWCSVKHHHGVRKVVVLMVPGLELDMFNGQMILPSPEKGEPSATVNADSRQLAGTQLNEMLPESTPQASAVSAPQRKAGYSPDDYYPVKLEHDRLPRPLQPLLDVFNHIWPVRTPGEEKNGRMHSPLASMLTVPLVKTKEEKSAKGPQFPREGKNWKNARTPVTAMLATTAELAEQGYVLHPAHIAAMPSPGDEKARREADKTTAADGWIDTINISSLSTGQEFADKDNEAGSLTAGRKVLIMDCEMCVISPKGVVPTVLALTRISIVDWDGKVVMDDFVQPKEPITDYVTPYSGITPAKLEGVTTTLEDIQAKLKELFTPDAIVVGHSLESDFNALKMTHPYIIDTALLYPHPRGPPLKSSLKWLAKKYLSRDIQQGHGTSGHDSVEDAQACLDLVKQKCEKGLSWGTSEASGEPISKRLGRSKRPTAQNIVVGGGDEFRMTAVVDWGDPSRGYGSSAAAVVGCQSDAEIVRGVKRTLVGDETDASIPTGGCDFVWARMRELEAHRGWWNKSKTAETDAMRAETLNGSTRTDLAGMVAQTANYIRQVYDELPPCTALIVYSGSGDPRDLQTMQEMHKTFKEEYRIKKWDQLSVKWTDVEEQRLRKACEKARLGCGFVTVK